MMRGIRRGPCLATPLTLLMLWALPHAAAAQATAPTGEYVIGVEDVLQISVWAHPELERTVTVNEHGNVVVPPIGELKADGLTARQLGDRIADRLSTYLRQGATTVTVTVREYVSQSVIVSGSVARPGRYGAETAPQLLDALNLAGGALPTGDMARVTIIRKTGPAPYQIIVDVAAAMREGTTTNLPKLQAGDMIVVPAAVSLTGGIGNEQAVGVLGAVNRPGLYPMTTGEDLWTALALAGGPSSQGNLASVHVLTREESGQTAVTVNLRETLQRGNKSPFVVKPGDIVFVDTKRIGNWQAFTELLGATVDVVNLVAVIRVLQNP